MKTKFFLIMILLCAVAQGAWAQSSDYSKSYVECSWNETEKKVESTVKYYASSQHRSSSSDDWWGFDGNAEFYSVEGNISVKAINVMAADRHLVLRDGATLNVKHIKLEPGASLHIHTQSGVNGEKGKLNVDNSYYSEGSYEYAAGIGGGNGASSGDLYIHGGTITTKGYSQSAAIGGGKGGSCGKVVIYDGKVDATGGLHAAGIGGGEKGSAGDVSIYGGDITVFSAEACGIGPAPGGEYYGNIKI
jgi:hypothetical protein